MKFDSARDFSRAYEHFENDSKFGNSEFNHSEMTITFECKNGNGAVVRQNQIEREIFYKNFEYDTFEVIY